MCEADRLIIDLNLYLLCEDFGGRLIFGYFTNQYCFRIFESEMGLEC